MTAFYRAATAADAATLDRIFDATFCGTFGHLYRREDLAAFLSSYGIADWETDLDDPACAFRVAEAEGAIAGYVKLAPLTLPVEPRGEALMLDQLYVLEAHHGSGIAQALMDWAIEEARLRGAAELYLTVFTGNPRARRFYERHGFTEVGPYHFMVGNHADEDIILRKTL
jgi:ribosomal protein S18 acetylase RimI-like enzyme